MGDDEKRPATWVDPQTGQVWVLPRRYVPEHFVRVDENEARDE
jgi:hypothetical protein